MTTHTIGDEQLLQQHPRVTVAATTATLCGGGIDQPGWDACGRPGVWRISTYRHPYCGYHGAMRVRAAVRLDHLNRQQRSAA